MRRPRFARWIREEVLAIAGTTSFNLRKLAAKAQRTSNSELACALMLHAHEKNQMNRLLSYVYDEELYQEFTAVEARLGPRSVERLALRGTPMMSLPEIYREMLDRYNDAYHAPERIAAEKQALWDDTRKLLLKSGESPAEVARALNLDAANLSAYLARGDTGRFTLETVRAIADYAKGSE